MHPLHRAYHLHQVQGTPNMDGPFINPDPFDGEPTLDQILENANVGDPETVAQKMAAEIRIARPHHSAASSPSGRWKANAQSGPWSASPAKSSPLLEREFGDLDALYEPSAGAAAAE